MEITTQTEATTMWVAADANTDQAIEWGFATISDALDACERIDPNESRGVYARRATEAERGW